MLRCMILLFSFLLITLSAAHLGRDEQLVRVLGLRPDPAVTVREDARNIPVLPQQQASSGTTRTIRECSRWLTAKRKPACSYNRNYNGYWLYYFDAESGRPVKATMKSE